MITLNELRGRVEARKREMDSQRAALDNLRAKLTVFVEDIKKRSVIYNLLKNLPVWQDIEKLVKSDD